MKNKKAIVFISCFLIVLAATAWFVFKNLALWLVVSDPMPKSLDVIFTFGGDETRVTYSKSLFLQNPLAEWVISHDNKKVVHTLAKQGLDTSRIILVDTCKTTVAEVAFISDWLRNAFNESASQPNVFALRGVFSKATPLRVGLVSSPFHMRRINLAVSRIRKNSACVFYYLPAPFGLDGFSRQDYKTWWNNKYLRQTIYLEYFKFFKVLLNF